MQGHYENFSWEREKQLGEEQNPTQFAHFFCHVIAHYLGTDI